MNYLILLGLKSDEVIVCTEHIKNLLLCLKTAKQWNRFLEAAQVGTPLAAQQKTTVQFNRFTLKANNNFPLN